MPITGGKSILRTTKKRKPLRDVSNAGFKLTVTKSVLKKPNPQTKQQQAVQAVPNPIDQLRLARSDLSALIRQIDKLVEEALEKEVRNEKEIESFANVLHEMQSSLKPWVSRFQKILPTRDIVSTSHLETSLASMQITPCKIHETSKKLVSPDVDKFDFLVSPSPLVSWPTNCAADGGRNLFLLTPMPKHTPFPSRLNKPSKSVFEKITSDVTVRPVGPVSNINTVDNAFSSPEKVVRRNDSVIVSTPYMRMSPPKSCMLLEPSSVCCNKTYDTKKQPMDPVGGGSGDSDPSLSSAYLALKYPELFGIMPACKVGNSRKVVEASPIWCMPMSPPKTCVLLEPGDNDQIKDAQTQLDKAGDIPSVVSCKKEVIDSTPMCKDLNTTILKGKRAGENTLKKELWTRFEAATARGFHIRSSSDHESGNNSGTNNGFMDLLEEVS